MSIFPSLIYSCMCNVIISRIHKHNNYYVHAASFDLPHWVGVCYEVHLSLSLSLSPLPPSLPLATMVWIVGMADKDDSKKKKKDEDKNSVPKARPQGTT